MRKFIGLVAAAAVAVGITLVGPGALGASALSPGVSFSAANLPTWQANGVVWAIGQTNGVVVAGGTFTQLTPPPGGSGAALAVSALGILNAETGAPTSCQIPVTLAGGTPTVRAITTSPDGSTVYIGGNFSKVGTKSISRLAAIDPIACTVKSFTPPSISATVRALAVTGGSVYFAGDFQTVGGQPRGRFAAVNSTSGALQDWAPSADLSGRALAVSPDGTKVAIGGDFDYVNGQDSHSLAVVDSATGGNVRTYPLGFISQTSVTKAITSSGGSFYVGNEGTGGGVFDGRLAVDWSTLNERWRDTCLGATQAVLVYKDTLYSAVHAHDCNSMDGFQDGKRNYFIAEGTDAPVLKQWFPVGNDGINEGIGPRALVVSTGKTTGKDYLWAAGEFTRINNAAQQGLTRFGPDDTSTPPVPTITAEALTANQVQVRVRTVVDIDNSDLTYSIFRNGSSTPIWSGTASSYWWIRPQITFIDTTVTPGTSYTYRVSVSDGTNTSALSGGSVAKAVGIGNAYATGIIADHPSLYWRYDETTGTIAQDKSGVSTTTGLNGQYADGVTLGSTGALAGDTSKAASFDGVDDYIWNDQYKDAPATYSIETWFKTTTTQGGKLVGYGSGRPRTDNGDPSLSGNYDRQIYMDNSGRLIFGVWTGSASYIQTPSSYNDGGWHHVVGTQGAGGMQLFLDGVKVGSNGVTGNQAYKGVWHVGGDNLNGWPSQPTSPYFRGDIDETAIYPGPLAAKAVANHYKLGGGTPNVNEAPADTYGAAVFDADPDQYWRFNEASGPIAQDSGFSKTGTGTYGSGVTHVADGIVADGVDIATNGTNDGVVVGNQRSSGPKEFSLELWFKSGTTSGGKLIGFEDATSGPGSNYDKQLYMTNSGQLVFGVYIGNVQSIQSASAYNDNKWHYVVASQNSGGMSLRVDGSTVGTNPTTTSQSFTGSWRIGGGNLGGWPSQPTSLNFAGSLDEVAVYSQALTTSQMSSHYGLGKADNTAPSVPANVSAAASGSTANVSWNASTDNLGVTGYQLYRGTTAGFTADAASKIADVDGTSYADATLPPDTYYYRVAAVDGAGNVSAPSASASVVIVDTEAPSDPQEVEAHLVGTTVTVGWIASTDNVAVAGYSVYRGTTAGFTANAASKIADVTDPTYSDDGLPIGTYYYKVVAVDSSGLTSAAVSSAAVAVSDTTAPTAPTGLTVTPDGTKLVLAWTESTDNVGVSGYSVYRGSSADFVVGPASKLSVVATPGYTDETAPIGTSYYKVFASDAAGNLSAAAAASGAVADTVAPSVPADLAATVSGTTATLAWTASTDNVGVSGYTVYRGASAGFTADASSKVADVSSAGYADTGLAAGTYYYKVTAVDAATNRSAATDAVSAVVASAPVQPTVVTIAPTADAMVAQAASGTNYGTANYLSTRGGATGALQSLFGFNLPAAPAGKVLTGATLQLRTSTDTTSGSTDTHSIKLVTGAWTEAAVTWANRPTATGSTVGTLSGLTAVNAPYTTVLDASVLSPLVGTSVSFLVAESGTTADNLRLWSKESTTAAYRPSLVLTYTAP
ncbi:LamG-like jellyroll fold domain-containing protein [Leifsonia sp. Leaf264]|uniref:LamG-like jellyroll fold domain-containing protein n=1 Tax=Leifsonia sp. Leaf264 TaxID=1736314 RepID=UPI0006F678F2|nr:LamG-like jellyroll fold domain-containing protein [Leifsonia sp. Leaf264]KQO97535.1 hypothetical protein ASF30_14005 [Leifsonia sp. Leaf264]